MDFKEISGDAVTRNSYKLAEMIWDNEINPDIIYSIDSGGGFIAPPMRTYFDYWRKKIWELTPDEKREPFKRARKGIIAAYSYDGTKQGELKITSIDPDPRTANGTIIIAEDVVDTCKTIRGVSRELELRYGIRRRMDIPFARRSVLFVSHDFKFTEDVKSLEDMPDLCYNILDNGEGDQRLKSFAHSLAVEHQIGRPFLRYASHELDGLEPAEVCERFNLKNRLEEAVNTTISILDSAEINK